jgi:hypothetical protein
VWEDGLQLFQLQGRGDTEHALVTVETAVRHQNVGVGIKSEEISKTLNSNDRAGDGIIFGNRLLEKDLQGFPGTAAEISKKLPIIEKVTTEDFREAKDKMPVGNLLEYIYAQPFPEFHYAFLMTGRTEMTALAGEAKHYGLHLFSPS